MRLQRRKLLGGKLKDEVLWETVEVAAERLIECLGCHSVESREIATEYDALAANDQHVEIQPDFGVRRLYVADGVSQIAEDRRVNRVAGEST